MTAAGVQHLHRECDRLREALRQECARAEAAERDARAWAVLLARAERECDELRKRLAPDRCPRCETGWLVGELGAALARCAKCGRRWPPVVGGSYESTDR